MFDNHYSALKVAHVITEKGCKCFLVISYASVNQELGIARWSQKNQKGKWFKVGENFEYHKIHFSAAAICGMTILDVDNFNSMQQ